MIIPIEKCNPFVRAAEIQPAVLEGEGPRLAYDYRLFAVLENSGTLIIGEKEYPVSKGTVIYIPINCGYYFRGRIRVAVLNFDVTRVCDSEKKALCPSPATQFDYSRIFDTTAVRGLEKHVVIDGGSALIPAFTNIVTAFKNGDKYSDAVTSSLIKGLLCDILKLMDSDIRPERRLADKVLGYVRTYASEISGNEDVARHFGYHPVYVATVFKNETGKTLHSAITEQRIADACRWLLQTNASIDEIAYSIGFSSRPHFCTVFKKHTGMSPREWRNKKDI